MHFEKKRTYALKGQFFNFTGLKAVRIPVVSVFRSILFAFTEIYTESIF